MTGVRARGRISVQGMKENGNVMAWMTRGEGEEGLEKWQESVKCVRGDSWRGE